MDFKKYNLIVGKNPQIYVPYTHYVEFNRIPDIDSIKPLKNLLKNLNISNIKNYKYCRENSTITSWGCNSDAGKNISIYSLSKSIKHIIIIAVSIINNKKIVVEEIENGIHYSYFKILWDFIFSQDTQIIATTHSMDCIKGFVNSCTKPEETILYRLEKDKTITYNYDTLNSSLKNGWEVR